MASFVHPGVEGAAFEEFVEGGVEYVFNFERGIDEFEVDEAGEGFDVVVELVF